MKKLRIVSSIFLFLLSPSIMLANDAAEADMLIELRRIDGLNELMEGYQKVIDGNIADQLTAMTGTTSIGEFLNGTTEKQEREWSPSDWANALSGGNNQRYKELLEEYQKSHPTLSDTDASKGMSSSYATDYQQQVKTNQAASTNATYAYDQTNKHLEIINQLSDEINHETDAKHIQDLNARINAEIAYLQVEVIKGLSIVNEQLAQQQATDIQNKTAAAKFNTIPE